MYTDLHCLLESWGFPELTESFIENGVGISILRLCQFEEIAPLLTGLNFGQKIKFKRNFEAWERTISIEIISEISLDFDALYPNNGQNLFSSWPIFKEKLKTLFQRKLENNKGLEGISQVLGIDITVEGYDLTTVNALRALALLLAVCKPIKGEKLTWKPTKGDAVDGIITIVQSSSDLKNVVERKKALCKKYGLSFQPLPLVLVDNLLKSCSSFVVINECYYNFDSPIVALDFCFKSFHVLNAKYPAESKVAWNFIQTQLFKLITDEDENLVVVKNFVEDFKTS